MAWTAEEKREYNKQYYSNNREYCLEYNRQYKLNNSEKVKESNRKSSIKRRNDPEKFIKIMHEGIINRTRKKGFDESKTITIRQLTNLVISSNGKCAKTNLALTVERKSPFLASPDRIDSSKGYVKGNIQLVCHFYNILKRNYTDEHAIQRFAELKQKMLDI